jgi:hypothetical protein
MVLHFIRNDVPGIYQVYTRYCILSGMMCLVYTRYIPTSMKALWYISGVCQVYTAVSGIYLVYDDLGPT